jgi:hypothetical protein
MPLITDQQPALSASSDDDLAPQRRARRQDSRRDRT